jgi:hypothetical protein
VRINRMNDQPIRRSRDLPPARQEGFDGLRHHARYWSRSIVIAVLIRQWDRAVRPIHLLDLRLETVRIRFQIFVTFCGGLGHAASPQSLS